MTNKVWPILLHWANGSDGCALKTTRALPTRRTCTIQHFKLNSFFYNFYRIVDSPPSLLTPGNRKLACQLRIARDHKCLSCYSISDRYGTRRTAPANANLHLPTKSPARIGKSQETNSLRFLVSKLQRQRLHHNHQIPRLRFHSCRQQLFEI